MTGIPRCPACGATLEELRERCPVCAADLLPLLRGAELPDHYYNQAVRAARERRWHLAAERLAVTLALRPDDADGLVLLGKVRYWQGRLAEARSAFQAALALEPEREDARLAIESVKPTQRLAARVPSGSGLLTRRHEKGGGH